MQDTEIVWVEAISTFRMIYAVKVPKGKEEWALDAVTCNDAKEVGQDFLGETIVSSRIVTEDEYIKEFDKINHYLKDWSTDKKLNNITDISKEE